MRYYKLNKTDTGRQWYKCYDDIQGFEAVIIYKSNLTALIEQSTKRLDITDCTEITHKEYYQHYDDAFYIINHSQF